MTVQLGLEQEAFKTLLEKFHSQIDQEEGWQKGRLKAWDHYLTLGLPSRNTEVFRYIKLRNLFSQPFERSGVTTIDAKTAAAFIYPECRQAVLVFVNGDYCAHLSNTTALPAQVAITTLQEAVQTYGTLLNNHWNRSLKEETDPFAAINGALHRKGAFLYIPPKTVIQTPIQILNLVDGSDQIVFAAPRLNIFAGAHSQAVFSETIKSLSGGYFVNQVVEAVLEENAHLHYSQDFCQEDPTSWHFSAIRASLKRNAVFKTTSVTEGSATVRSDYRIGLTGENAEVFLNGVWMLADKREAHTNVFIDHQAPNCRSSQLFKTVLNDFSRSSFEGKIMVRQAAQKTEAFQLNNNLLLSDHAHADSKPNLEIFADDVKASHGATVGQLDGEQLFYMKTRGFQEAAAKNLLVYGFCEEVIEMLPLASVREAVSSWARNYLKTE